MVVAAAASEEPAEVEAEVVLEPVAGEAAPVPVSGQEAVAVLRNVRGSPSKVPIKSSMCSSSHAWWGLRAQRISWLAGGCATGNACQELHLTNAHTLRQCPASWANIDISCLQVRRVLDTIRGKTYEEALIILEYMPHRACEPILKALVSVSVHCPVLRLRSCLVSSWESHTPPLSVNVARFPRYV